MDRTLLEYRPETEAFGRDAFVGLGGTELPHETRATEALMRPTKWSSRPVCSR